MAIVRNHILVFFVRCVRVCQPQRLEMCVDVPVHLCYRYFQIEVCVRGHCARICVCAEPSMNQLSHATINCNLRAKPCRKFVYFNFSFIYNLSRMALNITLIIGTC